MADSCRRSEGSYRGVFGVGIRAPSRTRELPNLPLPDLNLEGFPGLGEVGRVAL